MKVFKKGFTNIALSKIAASMVESVVARVYSPDYTSADELRINNISGSMGGVGAQDVVLDLNDANDMKIIQRGKTSTMNTKHLGIHLEAGEAVLVEFV